MRRALVALGLFLPVYVAAAPLLAEAVVAFAPNALPSITAGLVAGIVAAVRTTPRKLARACRRYIRQHELSAHPELFKKRSHGVTL
jgi:hypothetical protein